MSQFFCHSETGLPVAVKTAAFAAGYLVKKNNPELVARILPVAEGVKKSVDNGVDNEAMNALLARGINQLVPLVSPNPLIQAGVAAAITQLGLELEPEGSALAAKVLSFDNESLKDIVDSFVAGLESTVAE